MINSLQKIPIKLVYRWQSVRQRKVSTEKWFHNSKLVKLKKFWQKTYSNKSFSLKITDWFAILRKMKF